MKRILVVVAFALAGLVCLVRSYAAPAAKPNVVLILADDLGWTDLGCYGSDLYGNRAFPKRTPRNEAIR